MDTITDEMLDKYFDVTSRAIKAVEGNINEEHKEKADIFFKMAQDYYDDADHFRDRGDKLLAYGALNYAHAWLDAGARVGFFKVYDSDLFTVDG